MKQKRWSAMLVAAALLLLLLPAAAAEAAPDRAAAAQKAIETAALGGDVTSIQYALWEDGEITLAGQSGVYSKTEDRALTKDALYGIASVSKVYTTTAAMLLVEQGKLDLEKPVTTYLPEFRMADPRYKDITVRMLLNHSSGIMGTSLRDAFLNDDPTETGATDQLLARLTTQRLKADPGAYSVYCNDGFTLAELVVEAVSGLDFTDFIHQYITGPLELNSTYTPADDFDRNDLAKTYKPGESRALPPENIGMIGTGGLYSTAADLAAFGGALTEPGLLSQASLDAMAVDESVKGMWPEGSGDDVLAYGLGWDNVHMYPFNQNGIQALVKGGDTQRYHAGLIVLPEHNMAVAVVSSGGSSVNNELAGASILMDALSERGVTVDKVGALPQAEPTQMPEAMAQNAGTYGGSGIVTASFEGENQLTLSVPAYFGGGGQQLTYYSDGSFRNEQGSMLLRFVTEENGHTYLLQQTYMPLPGMTLEDTAIPAPLAISSYVYERFAENPISDEIQSAWNGRSSKLYLMLDEKYTSQYYDLSAVMTSMPQMAENPGYMMNNRILDAFQAEYALQVPGSVGRDGLDLRFFQQDGTEYLNAGNLYMDSTAAGPVYSGPGAYCTIQPDGYARWYQVGNAGGMLLSVEVPQNGGFYVYDQDLGVTASSVLYGDTEAALPVNGWIVFAGEPGARFHLSVSEPPVPEVSAPGQFNSIDELTAYFDSRHQAVEKPDIDLSAYVQSFSTDESFNIYDYMEEKPFQGSAVLTMEQVQEDLDVLFRALETTYGPYYYFGGDEVFGAAKQAVLDACAGMEQITASALEQAILGQLTFMKDGHFSINGQRISDVVIRYLYSEVAFLKDDQGYYTQQGSKRVTAVDGYESLDSLFCLSISEAGQVVYYPGVNAYFNGEEPGPLTVHYNDGTTDTLNRDTWTSGWKNSTEPVALHENTGIPVLYAKNMGFDLAPGDTIGKAFLNYAEQLKDEPVLIVDLRFNGGGNGILPIKWLRAYTGEVVPTNYRSLMAMSMEDIEEFTQQTENQYYNSMEDFQLAGTWAVSDHYVETDGLADRFVDNDKLLIVLTGKNTASAAEMFTDMVHNVANTLVIGQNTYGMLTSNAYTSIFLPNSGCSVVVGGNLCFFPEGGYFEEFNGFQPDLWTSGDAEELAVRLVRQLQNQ